MVLFIFIRVEDKEAKYPLLISVDVLELLNGELVSRDRLSDVEKLLEEVVSAVVKASEESGNW